MWIIKWRDAPYPYFTGPDWSAHQRMAARWVTQEAAKRAMKAAKRLMRDVVNMPIAVVRLRKR